ncbi:MAG: enoyl-CoA hydratase/isomerase family protein, partial [SAR324 cluster bacterium]|nr:enoyl-CoA hydratase/isomerase family protein [SAR324 cluster bacterium]
MYETVLVERTGPVATVTMTRPEALNAFNGALRRDVAAAVTALNADDDVRALVIRGAGERAFSA